MAQRSSDREAIEAEIDRVRSLGLDELRTLWRDDVPLVPAAGLHQGPHRPVHLLAHPGAGLRRARSGNRKASGRSRAGRQAAERTGASRPAPCSCANIRASGTPSRSCRAAMSGARTTYASLSTIARAITGTAWNGPRFFGLRTRRQRDAGCRRRRGSAGSPDCDATRRQRRSRSPGKGATMKPSRTKGLPLRDLHPQIDRA